jgi:hypothetical protein
MWELAAERLLHGNKLLGGFLAFCIYTSSDCLIEYNDVLLNWLMALRLQREGDCKVVHCA